MPAWRAASATVAPLASAAASMASPCRLPLAATMCHLRCYRRKPAGLVTHTSISVVAWPRGRARGVGHRLLSAPIGRDLAVGRVDLDPNGAAPQGLRHG